MSSGSAGEPCTFTVYTKGAGAGALQVAVEGKKYLKKFVMFKSLFNFLTVQGPSKAEISCKDNKDGTVGVTYVPPAPGEYKINCKFAEKPIKGSPFSAKIVGEGRKRNQLAIAGASEKVLTKLFYYYIQNTNKNYFRACH